MPTDIGRALSLQQQRALELIADQAGQMAGALLYAGSQSVDRQQADAMSAQYATLLTGAMLAVAATRAGYLQRFAAAEGQPMLDIPAAVLQPTVQDVLVGGKGPPPPPARGVTSTISMEQTALRLPSQQGGMRSALAQLDRDLKANVPDALRVAQSRIADYTESTAHATADYVDSMVLGPSRTISALRRIAHPGACERCLVISGILVFKTSPRLRHPQCKCSFEPVYLTDPEYKGRLARYQENADYAKPGAYGRDRRYRGRTQLAAAEQRVTSEFTQDSWTSFLKEEQTRLASLVTALPSNEYRNWAIMTSVKQAEAGGSDMLPVIIRN